jgi:NAD-dependent SIR2 family protein deacetylase
MSDDLKTRINKARNLIKDADHILIGAGAGLSTAAGLLYSGERFTNNFQDFIAKYNFTDLYSSSFYPFKTQEEKWAYFSRHIKLNRFDAEVGIPYFELLKLVETKNYFVLTTNVDALFHKAGFDKAKVFMVQGDYGKNQCAKGCHKILYDNEKLIKEMVLTQKDCMIPTALIPKCPVCGGDMAANLRGDEYFVEDEESE